MRADIIESCLEPGDHVAKVKFTEQLGISWTPVREALLSLQRSNFFYLAGGIMAHLGRPTEGASSLEHAWEAARRGVTLGTYAGTYTQSHPVLKRAPEGFGPL